jgi:hypothetical protein
MLDMNILCILIYALLLNYNTYYDNNGNNNGSSGRSVVVSGQEYTVFMVPDFGDMNSVGLDGDRQDGLPDIYRDSDSNSNMFAISSGSSNGVREPINWDEELGPMQAMQVGDT